MKLIQDLDDWEFQMGLFTDHTSEDEVERQPTIPGSQQRTLADEAKQSTKPVVSIIRTHNESEAQDICQWLRERGFTAIVRHSHVEVLQ